MKRVSTTIDENLKKTIEEMAKKKNWSLDFMVYVLLQQAVKEKLRKSKSESQSST